MQPTEKLFKKAVAKHRAGKLAEAEDAYRTLVRREPNHLDGHYLLGTLYAERGRLDAALKHLLRAAELAPASPFVHNNLGNVYQMAGDPEGARRHFEQALALKPDLAQARHNLGNVLRRLGRPVEAVAAYREALAVDPGFVDAHCSLGGALLESKDFAAAEQALASALALDPNHAKAHARMGELAMERGDRDRAVFHLRRSLELAPRDEGEARVRLARLAAAETPARYPEEALRQTYEKKAASWDSDIARPGMEFLGPRHVRDAVQRLLPDARELAVLDLGCGTGACGEFLRSLAARLDGVDLSPHMLAEAKRKSLYDRLECAEIVAFMERADAAYDLVTASGVLILVGDLAPVFAAAARALRPGGLFVFTLYRSDDAPVAVRPNLHFAHGQAHVAECAAASGLAVALLEDVIHEYDYGVPQPGYLVALRRGMG